MTRGWWNMACWNGLSVGQQLRLIHVGNLPFGYQPGGECQNGAAVAIETEHDLAPGPRFYCVSCAIEYLNEGQFPLARSVVMWFDEKPYNERGT